MEIIDFDEDFIDMVHKDNEYLIKKHEPSIPDDCSLSFLIDKKIANSEAIRLGIAFESVSRDFIMKKTNLENIKEKNRKGEIETDHLFEDKTNKIIYYAELKGNLKLDTEKSKKTYQKCQETVEKLKLKYPDYEIKWCLVGFRYIDKDEMPNFIKAKYKEISSNLFGINEYYRMFGIRNGYSTPEKYRIYMNKLFNDIFSNS